MRTQTWVTASLVCSSARRAGPGGQLTTRARKSSALRRAPCCQVLGPPHFARTSLFMIHLRSFRTAQDGTDCPSDRLSRGYALCHHSIWCLSIACWQGFRFVVGSRVGDALAVASRL